MPEAEVDGVLRTLTRFAQTDDEQLLSFLRARLGVRFSAPQADLVRARDVLRAIAASIAANDDVSWAAVREAHRALLPQKAPAAAKPATTTRLEPVAALATTETFDGSISGPALPFDEVAPSMPAPSTIELEHYAALCASLRAWPQTRTATLRAYGIRDEGEFVALETSWTEALRGEPALQATFRKLVDERLHALDAAQMWND